LQIRFRLPPNRFYADDEVIVIEVFHFSQDSKKLADIPEWSPTAGATTGTSPLKK